MSQREQAEQSLAFTLQILSQDQAKLSAFLETRQISMGDARIIHTMVSNMETTQENMKFWERYLRWCLTREAEAKAEAK